MGRANARHSGTSHDVRSSRDGFNGVRACLTKVRESQGQSRNGETLYATLRGRGTGAACRRQCSILTLTDPATRRRRLFGERTNTGCGCACWTRGYGLDSTRSAGTLNWTRGVPVTERVRWMRIGSGTGIGKSYDRRLSEAPWTGRLIGRGARDEGPACPPCQGPDKGLQCRGDSMSISCTWGAEPLMREI